MLNHYSRLLNFFIVMICSLAFTNCYSQINISGTVTDSLQQPIASASITLHKANSSLIIAYAISNAKGGFVIQYNKVSTSDTFTVKANAIGYKIKQVRLQSFNQNIEFVLNASNVQLPNVTVKNAKPFLKYKADTLSYAVDSFAQKQDRTIGDVLKKMPGIEVDGNGKISYNGKAISNFYIDGDNLLDDKYNIATNSIAADMVKDVQVLENHQPIRALKNAALSDKVAINLNLKDKARLRLTARAELGGGYANEPLYDGTINLMAFKKNYKAINSFKANNTGVDISNDVVSHNIMDFYKAVENNVPNDMLGLNYPNNPNINQQRYLFNNAALANTNNLHKTKDGVQIKVNLYYLYDKQQQDYSNNSFYYLPNSDTVKYLQHQNTENRFNVLYAQINLNSNKDKTYWNNKLVIEYNKLPSYSTTNFNGKFTNQNLLQNTSTINNEFNTIKTIHTKNVIEWYSYISYLNKPELLQVQPGLNVTYFNNNIAYLQLSQQANVPTFFTNNYINYRVPSGKILQSYKVGFNSQWQQLQSNASVTQINNAVNNVSDSFINRLQWKHQKVYANANWDYMGERTKITFSLPINWQHIGYSDSSIKTMLPVNFNEVFINPSINIKYATGIENFITANYTFGNSIANIQDVYGGYILSNYNKIMFNNIAIRQSNMQIASLSYNYRKTIKIFFFNIAAIYSNVNNNSIAQTELLNSLQRQTIIPLNNRVNSFTLFSGVSKYLFKLHATVNLKASIKTSNWNQLQNGLLLGYMNNTYNVSAGISPKINKWLNIAYNGNYTLSNSKAEVGKTNLQAITQMQHSLEINTFLNDNCYMKFKGEDFYIRQHQINVTNAYFFADASFHYKLNKIKTDFSFDVMNIANTQNYSTVNISANNLTQSAFAIRPRMFLLKAFFNF